MSDADFFPDYSCKVYCVFIVFKVTCNYSTVKCLYKWWNSSCTKHNRLQLCSSIRGLLGMQLGLMPDVVNAVLNKIRY